MPPIEFTVKEKNKIQIVDQEIVPDSFDDSKLPTDIHIVTYTLAGETKYDVVRAYTMVDIFDAYYDKLKGQGELLDIKSGYGKIRPNLYGKIKNEEWVNRRLASVSTRPSIQMHRQTTTSITNQL